MESRDNEVVLFENKVYHPHQVDVIGDDVEFVTFEETQALDEPLYRPSVETPQIATKDLPTVTFHRKFQEALLEHHGLIRSVAFVGHTGHGKSTLVDMLVQSTHTVAQDMFTSTHHLERSRQLTISTKVINLVLPNSHGKSYSVNVIDTPGHTDFWDQLGIGSALADTLMLVIDVCEPLLPTDLKAIEQAITMGKQLRLCFNKIDRLCVEQQRDCKSATTRIYYILDQINSIVENNGGTRYALDDILFASAKYKWCFTLDTVGALYSEYADNASIKAHLATPRVFSTYALEPIFKIFYAVLSGEAKYISAIFKTLELPFQESLLKQPTESILVKLFQQYFVNVPCALVDTLPEPSSLVDSSCEMYISRYLYHQGELYALAKIVSGSFSPGDTVHAIVDGDDLCTVINSLMLPHVQYNMQISRAFAGNLVLVGGLSGLSSLPGYSVVSADHPAPILKTPTYFSTPVFKVGVEPFDPAKMVDFLKNLEFLKRTWTGLEIKVEGTGEHIISGPGELYLDSALYSLRHDYEEVDIRVSYPVAQFSETVADYSSIMCPTQTPNGLNQITMLAEEFSQAVISDLKDAASPSSAPGSVLKRHGWSNLDIDSIITLGPVGVLVNECTLPKNDNLPHNDLIEGFNEYMNQGPLCGEPVRNVRLNVAKFDLAPNSKDRQSVQLVPTVRRACAAAHMVSEPRLLEPIYKVVCLAVEQAHKPIENILKSRRGSLDTYEGVPGTNFFLFFGSLPVLDSVGFETQVKGHCHDLVQVSLVFDRWSIVPGDPLDKDIATPKLTKAAASALSRDIVIRLRKRKGLSREPELANLLDYEVAKSLNLA